MKKFISEFKAFALRGNVMDLAVGVIIGGAFTALVTSLIIMAFVVFLLVKGVNKLATIGKKQTEEEEPAPEEPPKPTTEELLAEILEEIKNK